MLSKKLLLLTCCIFMHIVSMENNLNTQLIQAVSNKSVSNVRRLLKEGADPNSLDFFGNPPLSIAVKMTTPEGPEITKLLLQYGANVNAKAANGTTILCVAINALANNPNWTMDNRRQAMKEFDSQISIVRLLLAHGADTSCKFRGNVDILTTIKINPLMRVESAHHSKLLSDLVQDFTRLRDPLFNVVKNNNNEAIQKIARELQSISPRNKESIINSVDTNGNTPLHIAVRNKNKYAIKVLLSMGADPLIRNKKGLSAIDETYSGGIQYAPGAKEDMLSVFLESGYGRAEKKKREAQDQMRQIPLD